MITVIHLMDQRSGGIKKIKRRRKRRRKKKKKEVIFSEKR